MFFLTKIDIMCIVKVGLHQGSAWSPCLFAMVMDRMMDDIREKAPWTMMFADDIVICSESKERVEETLESWRYALERRGMKVNRRKTEYMCVNERQVNGTMKMQGEEVAKVEDFKYLGSTVQSNGECGREVKKRVQAGWNGWRRISGVICDRRVPARVKGKVYRVAVRPAMLYGLETVALTKRQEVEMEVAELKMLRFSLGVTRMDKIRNEYIRGTAQAGRFGEKTRDWGGMDMYWGKMMGILGEGCWEWSCQERGNGEGQKGDLWMWWKRTWLRLKWRRRMQKIGATGDGKSAVATPDGKKPKEEEEEEDIMCIVHLHSGIVYSKLCTAT